VTVLSVPYSLDLAAPVLLPLSLPPKLFGNMRHRRCVARAPLVLLAGAVLLVGVPSAYAWSGPGILGRALAFSPGGVPLAPLQPRGRSSACSQQRHVPVLRSAGPGWDALARGTKCSSVGGLMCDPSEGRRVWDDLVKAKGGGEVVEEEEEDDEETLAKQRDIEKSAEFWMSFAEEKLAVLREEKAEATLNPEP